MSCYVLHFLIPEGVDAANFLTLLSDGKHRLRDDCPLLHLGFRFAATVAAVVTLQAAGLAAELWGTGAEVKAAALAVEAGIRASTGSTAGAAVTAEAAATGTPGAPAAVLESVAAGAKTFCLPTGEGEVEAHAATNTCSKRAIPRAPVPRRAGAEGLLPYSDLKPGLSTEHELHDWFLSITANVCALVFVIHVSDHLVVELDCGDKGATREPTVLRLDTIKAQFCACTAPETDSAHGQNAQGMSSAWMHQD